VRHDLMQHRSLQHAGAWYALPARPVIESCHGVASSGRCHRIVLPSHRDSCIAFSEMWVYILALRRLMPSKRLLVKRSGV